MFQNTNIRKLRNISNQIDTELSKIDKLLAKLSKQTVKTKRIMRGIQNGSQRHQESFDSAKTRVEQKFNQTAYIYQEETYQYSFAQVDLQKEQEEILLQDYQYTNNYHYARKHQLAKPLSVKVQTKSNWLQKYLDHGDCEVNLWNNNTYVEIIGVQAGFVSCVGEANGFFKIDITEIYKQDSLLVNFTNHLQGVTLNTNIQGKPQIFQITLQNSTRFVLKCQGKENEMSRILIIKQIDSEEDIRYELTWGQYFKEELKQLIALEPGKYLLIPLGITPLAAIELYFQKLDLINFKVSCEEPLKTKNILMKTFLQLTPDTYQPSSGDIQQEYARNVYLDIGIVVQTYENIYLYQAKFQDEEQTKQDISLLFSKLYNPQQLQNRLRAGEKVVKFYSIEQKPAKLFIPRKYVYMGSKVMQTLKVHSVFK